MNIHLSYPDSLSKLYKPVEYILSLEGKKFRPMLCELTASLIGESNAEIQKLSEALEVFHNFTLMHDDVMDNAPLRRGQPTVYKKWGVSQAILSGDVMLIKAYELIAQLNDNDVKSKAIHWFNKIATQVCEGQQLDMDFEGRSSVSHEEYLEMIQLKTAVLIGLSMAFAGIGLNKDNSEIQELYNLGEKIGVLFQIQDDFLDCFGDPSTFGKQIGGDILEGKKTIVYLTALKLSKNQKKLEDLYREPESEHKVKQVLAHYDQSGVKGSIQTIMEQKYSLIIKKIHSSSLFKDTAPLEVLINKLYKRGN